MRVIANENISGTIIRELRARGPEQRLRLVGPLRCRNAGPCLDAAASGLGGTHRGRAVGRLRRLRWRGKTQHCLD